MCVAPAGASGHVDVLVRRSRVRSAWSLASLLPFL